jgi:carboxylesterase
LATSFTNDPYERARAGLKHLLDRDHDRIGESGRSLVYDHGRRTPRAAVLFHGLSASPTQFAAVAEALYARGYNVLVPRLPRHGYEDRMSDALSRLTAAQLRASATESFELARGLGEHVTVVGFSLGGLLAAYLAQHEPVDCVVAVAPFLGIVLVPSLFRRPLTFWALRTRNRFAWWDPFLRDRQLPAHGYPRYSTHAVAHALTIANDLLEAARADSPRARRIVLVTNARETAINNRAVNRLLQRWRKKKPEAVHAHRFDDLPLSHDIIEPLRHPDISQRVLRVLVELIDR